MTAKDELTDAERKKLSELMKKKNRENYKRKLKSTGIPPGSITIKTSNQDFNELYPERKYEWLTMADSHSVDQDEIVKLTGGKAHAVIKRLISGNVKKGPLCQRSKLRGKELVYVERSFSDVPDSRTCKHCQDSLRKIRAAKEAIKKAEGENELH